MRLMNPDRVRAYVFKEDRSPEVTPSERLRVLYKILSAERHSQLQDGAMEMVSEEESGTGEDHRPAEMRTIVKQGTQTMAVLMAAIVDVENAVTDDGREAVWPGRGEDETHPDRARNRTTAKRHFLSMFTPKQRVELANAILSGQVFTEEQRGNSGSPSGSVSTGTAVTQTKDSANAA